MEGRIPEEYRTFAQEKSGLSFYFILWFVLDSHSLALSDWSTTVSNSLTIVVDFGGDVPCKGYHPYSYFWDTALILPVFRAFTVFDLPASSICA
jgi:hypothetical protein